LKVQLGKLDLLTRVIAMLISSTNARRFIGLGLSFALAYVLMSTQHTAPAADTPKFSPDQVAFYEKQVLPILKASCLKCHSGKKARGGLHLDSRAGLLRGGDLGPALVLDKLDDSPLLKAIHHTDDLKMPPKGKLPAAQIDVLARWAKMGAPYTPAREEVVKAPAHKGMTITNADRNYWAYRPVHRPAVPVVRNHAWLGSPIDAFILAKLEAKGLAPAPPADRVALIRRACYDLTGLPPTPEEIDAFVSDTRPDAYERLVDRLLASPAYGEKWGRHWLDLVRFAETHGYERDGDKPFAWRYRDYVINAFNTDKPYGRFLTEQLAGDELDEPTTESLIATGYYRLGLWDDEPADRLQLHYDVLDGIVSTTAQVALGMTVGCARCHDHKRDPIAQRDYYRLLAFFNDITDMNVSNLRKIATPEQRRQHEQELAAKREREGKLYQEQYRIEQRFLAALASAKGISAGRLIGSDMVDLSYRFYRDTWEKLPDFEALKIEDSGTVANGYFSLAPASRTEAIGLVYQGKLKVPAAGKYTFFVESTDGARLQVNGKIVIDRTSRGRQRSEGTIDLSAGLVSIRLDWFNANGKPALAVAWQGPGVPRRSLTDDESQADGRSLISDSRRAGVEWRYTTELMGFGWYQPGFDDSTWKKGSGGFGQEGTPGAVVRTQWKTPNIWLRKTFDVTEIPAGLALNLHHDDDVQVYLNGRLIYRSRGYLVTYRRIVLGERAVAALRKGTNLLAIHCQQFSGGQYIDVGLVADAQADLASLMRKHGPELLGEESMRRHAEVSTELDSSRKTRLPEPGMDIMCVRESGSTPTRVLIRGNPHVPGEPVTPGFPEVLCNAAAKLPAIKPGQSSSKRRALAEWLTSPGNPATARVLANRLWQYHFGRGIVPTSSDFGKLGEAPTHPELLDYLASELVRDWSLKRLHRLIMLSSAYRMSSNGNPAALAKDPANMLFWRFNMRRLTAEEVRDSMLAVGGTLNLRMAGPGVYPTIPRSVLAGQSMPGNGWGKSPPEEQARRSVYVHVKRSLIVPILEAHDLADTDSSCAVRYTTTVPTQALAMLNGDFTTEQAVALAQRLAAAAPHDLEGQVKYAIRLTTGRTPTKAEVRHDVAFVKEMQAENKLTAGEALKLYCLMALNANEFMYLD
jgi:hypothetical protein